jgi:hypothetical protein
VGIAHQKLTVAPGFHENPAVIGGSALGKAPGQVIVDGQQTRRSLYIRARRTRPVAMLQSFDAPVMEIDCELCPVSTVAAATEMLADV